MPSTRPSGLVMPSMAHTEPLGFHWMSPLTVPSASTYWVATWPFSMSFRSALSSATNRPSPWDTGTVKMSPAFTPAIQGDFTLVTRVYTMRLTWRPKVLKVKVGSSSLGSVILP